MKLWTGTTRFTCSGPESRTKLTPISSTWLTMAFTGPGVVNGPTGRTHAVTIRKRRAQVVKLRNDRLISEG